MITFDTIVFAIIGLSGLIGFIRGFTKEILGLSSWGASLAAAYFGYPFANSIATQYIANPNIAMIATYLGIFICFLILFSIVSNVLSSYIRQTMLSGIDRTLGFGIGLIRSFILFAVFDLFASFFFPQEPAFLQNSKTITHIHSLSQSLYGILPKNWQTYLKDNQKSAKDLTEPKVHKTPEQQVKDQEQNAEDLAQLKPQSPVDQQAAAVGNAVSQMIEDGKSVIEQTAKDAIVNHLN